MKKENIYNSVLVLLLVFLAGSCKTNQLSLKKENRILPKSFAQSIDSANYASINWKDYYNDQNLIELIDTALKNNQEFNIFLQEIEISRNEIQSRKGEYLPFIGFFTGLGMEKDGLYTRHGAVDNQLNIRPGEAIPDPYPDYKIGLKATWEIDIWKKLRNAKQSAVFSFLASVEGKNLMQTHIVSEIADSYYELMALDNLLSIIERNISIQTSALKVVKQQKEAARLTQLAVNRFEAQLLNTQNLQYNVKQKLVEVENRINFLTGRYPKPIPRNSEFLDVDGLKDLDVGLPSQLLLNRPDIRKAEFELMAANLDVSVARANFYPSLGLTADLGFAAFKPSFLINPQSLLYNLAGDLTAPLINRNAIKASYKSANSKQLQAVYSYEQTVLNAYLDVVNQLAKVENYNASYNTKYREVEILVESIQIANSLFYSARADYGEVLLTQREALESRMELIEIKLKQLHSKVNIYRALGGGWK